MQNAAFQYVRKQSHQTIVSLVGGLGTLWEHGLGAALVDGFARG